MLETGWGSSRGTEPLRAVLIFSVWKVVLFEWVENVGSVFMGSVAKEGDNGQSLPDWLIVPWWSMWGWSCCRMAYRTSKNSVDSEFQDLGLGILVLLSIRLVIFSKSVNFSEVHWSKCEMGIDRVVAQIVYLKY